VGEFKMLAEDGVHIPSTPFQSREVKEDASGQFELLAKQANFGNESAMFLKGAMGHVKPCDVHASFQHPFNDLGRAAGRTQGAHYLDVAPHFGLVYHAPYYTTLHLGGYSVFGACLRRQSCPLAERMGEL
jgi:hypothetical protein